MRLRRARLSKDARAARRAARTPPTWVIWQVTRATLIAFLLSIVAYVAVGWLLTDASSRDDAAEKREVKRIEQESADRRAGICYAIVIVHVDAIARAFNQDPDGPDATTYRVALHDGLGFCPPIEELHP